MQSSLNTTQYPYRHVDPSNYGAKRYGIFQEDLAPYQDTPGWNMQDDISGFENTGQGGNGLQDDFSGFDNNIQPGIEFHDFIADGPWNPVPLPE